MLNTYNSFVREWSESWTIGESIANYTFLYKCGYIDELLEHHGQTQIVKRCTERGQSKKGSVTGIRNIYFPFVFDKAQPQAPRLIRRQKETDN